ncbi:hypothetical protein [Pseudomonas sp. O230]|uniref:hypothetical protein n=1 Tax=Pseudomonas sp. O230 TaxID=3159450 RepID=UPI00387A9D9E
MLLIVNKIRLGLVSIVILISMTGCGMETLRTLYVKSVPEGAVISADDGTPAPMTNLMYVEYYTSKLKGSRVNGCAPLGSFTATWPSGAKASSGPLRWCNLDEFNMSVNIEMPKNSPNIEADRKAGKDYVAQKKAADEQYLKNFREKAEYERLNPPPPPENSSDDDDISMSDALISIGNAYAVTQASLNRNNQNRAAPAQVPTIQKQSQLLISQQALAANQGSESTQSNAVNSGSSGSPYDYDVSHNQCVTYGRHPTLSAYAQYENTCPYDVSVTYCSVLKNGRDNCANRNFGNFELRAGGTNIAEGADTSVQYIVCKLPYRAIGAKTTVSGGQIFAPCQKNK